MLLGATRLSWVGGAGAERGGAKKLGMFYVISFPDSLSVLALLALLSFLVSVFGKLKIRVYCRMSVMLGRKKGREQQSSL